MSGAGADACANTGADACADACANTGADVDACANTGADVDIQLLRRPETLTQLCDIVTYPDYGMWEGYQDYTHIAETAAIKGQEVSPELWVAGMWALTRVGTPRGRIRALAIIVPEVCANVCSDYYCPNERQVYYPAWELLKIAYMICPKESPVFPLILYSLAKWMPRGDASPLGIQSSPGGGLTTSSYEDLLAAVLNNPAATARLRAIVLCAQFGSRLPQATELLYQAHAIDPTYVTVYTYLSRTMKDGVCTLGSRMLNRWGLALKAATNVVGSRDPIYYDILDGYAPQLDGTDISLGDSSMPVFDYICALETPNGSEFFRFVMRRTGMVPADTPWSCRRHEALDRHTGANALFATFLCALTRLESPGGLLRPSHQTMWEDALESWTLGDSAAMFKA